MSFNTDSGRFRPTESGKADILFAGELNMDLIMEQVHGLPEIGKERLAEGLTLTLGSSSAIMASNASALGLNVRFAGRVGTDLYGTRIREILTSRGIDTRYILDTPDIQTGLTVIYTMSGDRGMITYPGAMEFLTISDIPDNLLEQCRHFHVSSFYLQKGLRNGCATLFRRAKELGLTTSFDTNWDPDEIWGREILEILPWVDVFLPNDEEAMRISGLPTVEEALTFLSGYAGLVVATCGIKGVKARSGNTLYELDAIPVEPVDAVGAGDSFNAGFLYKYLSGASVTDCLKMGVITGAYSTTRAGGTAAFEEKGNFKTFLEAANPSIRLTELEPNNSERF